MGLALHKTIAEIRELPAPEFRRWQIYEMIEPFGFPDREYRTAAMLTMTHNVNAKRAKKVREFYRDMPREIVAAVQREIASQEYLDRLDKMTPEQRREHIRQKARSVFGA